VANLARKLKNYNDEVKASIYEKISERGLRFDSLAETSGRNRVTLSEYLVHGQEVSEVQRDPRSKEYLLTPKGQDELERLREMLLIARSRKEAGFEYHGYIKSIPHSIPVLPTAVSKDRHQAAEHMLLGYELPVPLSTTGSIYGSEELKFIQESEEDSLRGYGWSPREVPREMLDDLVRRYAEPFVWRFILRRLGMLLDWHEQYDLQAEADRLLELGTSWANLKDDIKPEELGKEGLTYNLGSGDQDFHMTIFENGARLHDGTTTHYIRDKHLPWLIAQQMRPKPKKPPPLTVENILGFDLSMSIRYDGTRLLKPATSRSGIEERKRAKNILLGGILMNVAYSTPESGMEQGVIDHLGKAGLLPKEEADTVNELYDAMFIDAEKQKVFQEGVYEIGWQYWIQAGLVDSKGKCPECGEINPASSFQRFKPCEKCGYRLDPVYLTGF
jgi:predicted transcriptional regulator